MKIVFITFAFLLFSGCSENDYTSEVLEDVAGVSMPPNAKLIEKKNDCCSFNGDGSFFYVYELPSQPSHKKCDYLGQYSDTSNEFSSFKNHLSKSAVCTFIKNIDDVYYYVLIQENKVMISWVVT